MKKEVNLLHSTIVVINLQLIVKDLVTLIVLLKMSHFQSVNIFAYKIRNRVIIFFMILTLQNVNQHFLTKVLSLTVVPIMKFL